MRLIPRLFVALTLIALYAPKVFADSYDGKPKLVVILVFDQFRGD